MSPYHGPFSAPAGRPGCVVICSVSRSTSLSYVSKRACCATPSYEPTVTNPAPVTSRSRQYQSWNSSRCGSAARTSSRSCVRRYTRSTPQQISGACEKPGNVSQSLPVNPGGPLSGAMKFGTMPRRYAGFTVSKRPCASQ